MRSPNKKHFQKIDRWTMNYARHRAMHLLRFHGVSEEAIQALSNDFRRINKKIALFTLRTSVPGGSEKPGHE